MPERRSLRLPASVARSSKKKLEEMTPSFVSRSPTWLELAWAGTRTVTRPWPEPWNGWNSSTMNQITAAATRIASKATPRPTWSRPRPVPRGGRGGRRLRRTGRLRRPRWSPVTRRVPAGASPSSGANSPPRRQRLDRLGVAESSSSSSWNPPADPGAAGWETTGSSAGSGSSTGSGAGIGSRAGSPTARGGDSGTGGGTGAPSGSPRATRRRSRSSRAASRSSGVRPFTSGLPRDPGPRASSRAGARRRVSPRWRSRRSAPRAGS